MTKKKLVKPIFPGGVNRIHKLVGETAIIVEYGDQLLSNEEVIKLLMQFPDGSIRGDSYDEVYFDYARLETDEEYIKRIADEEARLKKYEADLAAYELAVEAEKEAVELKKSAKDAKYQDHEYIEFLRLLKKLKDKGIIDFGIE